MLGTVRIGLLNGGSCVSIRARVLGQFTRLLVVERHDNTEVRTVIVRFEFCLPRSSALVGTCSGTPAALTPNPLHGADNYSNLNQPGQDSC